MPPDATTQRGAPIDKGAPRRPTDQGSRIHRSERSADLAVRRWLTSALTSNSDPAEVARLHRMALWLAGGR